MKISYEFIWQSNKVNTYIIYNTIEYKNELLNKKYIKIKNENLNIFYIKQSPFIKNSFIVLCKLDDIQFKYSKLIMDFYVNVESPQYFLDLLINYLNYVDFDINEATVSKNNINLVMEKPDIYKCDIILLWYITKKLADYHELDFNTNYIKINDTSYIKNII